MYCIVLTPHPARSLVRRNPSKLSRGLQVDFVARIPSNVLEVLFMSICFMLLNVLETNCNNGLMKNIVKCIKWHIIRFVSRYWFCIVSVQLYSEFSLLYVTNWADLSTMIVKL